MLWATPIARVVFACHDMCDTNRAPTRPGDFYGVCPRRQKCPPFDCHSPRLVLNSDFAPGVHLKRPMASKPLPNHLLAHRKRSALSQGEVAFLLGVHGSAKVSHHERFRTPSLETALAYEAIYQKPVAELFPGLFKQIQREVRARAKILGYRTFARSTAPVAARKRKSLAAIRSVDPSRHS